MKAWTIWRRALIGLLVVVLAAPQVAAAQGSYSAPAFSQEELDQMLAPIALYPDSLLAQILMAATYPVEVVQADRWLKQNKNLKGDQLNNALDKMNWDLSVKALVPFPDVLAMMSENLDWTQKVGDAFLGQQDQVMDTVQKLRARAHSQGNLNTTREQKVIVEQQVIRIEPAAPDVIYVPVYSPTVVYGPWWYPAYPPYVYSPYYSGAVVAAGVLSFAAGVAVGAAWNSGWGYWNWGRHEVNVNINRNININRRDYDYRNIRTSNWQHDSDRRRGVAYRDQASRERFNQRDLDSANARRDFRGYDQRSRDRVPGDPQRGGPDRRTDVRPSGAATPGTDVSRPRDTGRTSIDQRRSPGVFDGFDRGSDVKRQSERGRASREGISSPGGVPPSSMRGGSGFPSGGMRGGDAGSFRPSGGGMRGGGDGGGFRSGGGGGGGGGFRGMGRGGR
ncbi:MAG: DUF3300 domain-containing protein [Syntrophobacteraceae bacterium]|nr:DUF3300 domain-containing protein [Syntrophobacteraceae bacterium]